MIMLVTQRDAQNDSPRPDQLYPVGTVAAIMRMLKLPDGRIRLLVQGLSRARLDSVLSEEPYLKAKITRLEEAAPAEELPPEHEALLRSVKQNLEKSVALGKSISPEVMVIAGNLDDPARLADLAASNLELKLEEAQKILESTDAVARLRRVNELLAKEINVLEMQEKITSRAKGEIDKSQREYYLREQLKAIQQELGDADERSGEIAACRKVITDRGCPRPQTDAREAARPARADAPRLRRDLDHPHLPRLADGPAVELTSEDSRTSTEPRRDPRRGPLRPREGQGAHPRVPRRAQARKQSLKGPILCFVGPPGVGKTSLGQSIARALGRKFVRMSLGGVRDEAEIRGHRRTYVGAMPGRIIQALRRRPGRTTRSSCSTRSTSSARTSAAIPSAALLEVLDPEQNYAFRDHYLDVPFDLSKVFFITTANMLDPIPPALLDRMEVIQLCRATPTRRRSRSRAGYLIPRRSRRTASSRGNVEFTDAGIAEGDRARTPARRACATSSARSARSAARSPRTVAEGKRRPVTGQRRARSSSCSGRASFFRDGQPQRDQVRVSPPAWPGRRPAARSSSSRPR